MNKLTKSILSFLVGMTVVIGAVWLADPARFNQNLGDWCREIGYNSLAIKRYSRSIHLNANNPSAFNNRGATHYIQGQAQLAVQDYDQALQLDPQYAVALKNRALSLLHLSRAEEAKRDYSSACNLGQCEDFSLRCPEFKKHCTTTRECTTIRSAIKIGLCAE